MTDRSIITIGNFDGVHVGHIALVQRARQLADAKGHRVVAMAFDPHPATSLRPAAAPPRLTTWPRREELLRQVGADGVVRLTPSEDLLSLTPRDFAQWLVRDFAAAAVVEGEDFRFGRARSGDLDSLRELGGELGFAVEEVPPVEVRMSDESVARASSSLARWLLEHGRVRDAATVLGRPYEVEGTVETGDRRGRTIGFPTANVRTECLLPGDGVYGGVGILPDGRRIAAAISVGSKPTFGEHARVIEAYLLPVEESPSAGRAAVDPGAWQPLPGLPEYGWPLRLEIHHWLRDQARYGSVPALLDQMERDCRRTRELIEVNETNQSPKRGLTACR